VSRDRDGDPSLLAAATVLLSCQNPKKLMLGYLAGALMTSVTLGLVIVFALQDAVPSTPRSERSTPFWICGRRNLARDLVCDRYRPASRAGDRMSRRGKAPPRWQQALSKGSPRLPRRGAPVDAARLLLPSVR